MIIKEVVRKQQQLRSILVESVNSGSSKWYKIDIDIEPYSSNNNKSCCVDGSFDYYRHDHTFDLHHRFKSITPSTLFITQENQVLDVTSAAVIGHKLYKFIQTKIVFSDLDSPDSWLPLPSCPSITPLMRRSGPKLITNKGRLYVLACKTLDPAAGRDASLGLIFDPVDESWDTIANPVPDFHLPPNFYTVSTSGGIILLLPQHWLLDHQSRQWTPPTSYYLNTDTGLWCSIHTAADFLSILPSTVSNLVVVEQDSTIYGITSISGCIFAYNLDTHQTRFGPVIGLEYTHFFYSLFHDAMKVSLVHVTADFFCLMYQDDLMPRSQTSNLHCLITRIVKLRSSLFMNVVGCFRAPVSGTCCFRNSFLLR
ncbi:uncharacterized protein LOC141708230 [Apium graveolens]|uniref:uncharacterized protein LOC141708230 n=1 Tax=Apium graveolens TaxID=4045 RepID=UPI003D796438